MAIIECPNGFYDFVEKNFLSSVNLSFPESSSGYGGQGVDVYIDRHIRIDDWNYYTDREFIFHRDDYFIDIGGEFGYFFSSVNYTHYYPTLINNQTYSISIDGSYMFTKPELPSEIPYINSYSQKDNHKGKSLVTFTVKNIPSSTTELKFLICPSSATSFDNNSWQTFTVNSTGTYQIEVDGATNYVVVLEAIVDGYPKQNAISFTSIALKSIYVYVKHDGSYVEGTVYVKTNNGYQLAEGVNFNNGNTYK